MRRVEEVVAETLGIDVNRVHDALEFNSIPEWDSLNHVNLMLALETAYGTPINEDMMVELRTVGRIREHVKQDGASS
jgi:citrate synthase